MIHFDEKFWLAIAFFSFVALVVKYALPLIRKALDDSSKKIAEEILAAKEMKENAEKILEKAEQLYKDAISFSEKLIKDTEDEVQKLAAESEKLLADELAKRKAAALGRIKSEEEAAIRELKVKIVDSALKKLSNELDLNKEGHAKLIDKAVNNFGKTVH
jgi:F-type H+-transporting ATPase subunit b